MEREKELWGRKFKIVDNGLDETEVYSFVDSLTNQYGNFAKRLERLDTLVNRLAEQYGNLAQKLDQPDKQYGNLAQKFDQPDKLPQTHLPNRHTINADESTSNPPDFLTAHTNGNSAEFDSDKLENLDSLTRFAERTVVEAAKQAKIIKTEIEEKAKAKANSIISYAEEKARIEADRIIAEAELRTQERGKGIIAASQQEAQGLIELTEQKLAAFKRTNQSEAKRLIAEAKRAAEQQVQDILNNAKEKTEESAQIIKQEAEQLLAKKASELRKDELKEIFESIHQKLLSLSELFESPPVITTGEDSILVEAADEEVSGNVQPESTGKEPQEQHTSAPEKTEGEDPDLFDGTVELALPPPVALDQMLQLHKFLKETPHVDVLNLGGSVEKGITIRIVMDSPTPLLKIIGDLPEVGAISEEYPDAEKIVPSRQSGEALSVILSLRTTARLYASTARRSASWNLNLTSSEAPSPILANTIF